MDINMDRISNAIHLLIVVVEINCATYVHLIYHSNDFCNNKDTIRKGINLTIVYFYMQLIICNFDIKISTCRLV